MSKPRRKPTDETRFAYAGLWFESLHDAMDYAEKRGLPRADIGEVDYSGNVTWTEVHFGGAR